MGAKDTEARVSLQNGEPTDKDDTRPDDLSLQKRPKENFGKLAIG